MEDIQHFDITFDIMSIGLPEYQHMIFTNYSNRVLISHMISRVLASQNINDIHQILRVMASQNVEMQDIHRLLK